MLKSSKKLHKLQKREAILETALELFQNKGFSNVSTETIAKEANVAKGTVFHHFKSKDDLALAVVNRFLRNALEQLKQARNVLSAKETLRILIRESLKVEQLTPGFLELLLEITLRFSDEQVTDLTEEGLLPYLNFVTNLFQDLHVPNPWIRAQILIAVLDGIGIQLLLFEKARRIMPETYSDLINLEALVDQIMGLIIEQERIKAPLDS